MKLIYAEIIKKIIKSFFLLCTIACSYSNAQKFTLMTVLYNESHEARRQEYITCIETNLKHPLIERIHVLYDTDKDDEQNKLLKYLKTKNVEISYIKGRPTFAFCFNLANVLYPESRVILCNADIYFNESLHELESFDLTNKFLALTRWDVTDTGSVEIFKQYKKDGSFDDTMSYLSMDAWIFKTPIKEFVNANFQLGTWACDGYIAYQAYISGLQVSNPCLSIQCCHLHLSKVRHWIPQSIPGAKALINPWGKL